MPVFMHFKQKNSSRNCHVDGVATSLHRYPNDKVRALKQYMDIYGGVRLGEVLQAAYDQGKKDGRKEMIEKLDLIKKQTKLSSSWSPKKGEEAEKLKIKTAHYPRTLSIHFFETAVRVIPLIRSRTISSGSNHRSPRRRYRRQLDRSIDPIKLLGEVLTLARSQVPLQGG
jgi:hypothetical protein